MLTIPENDTQFTEGTIAAVIPGTQGYTLRLSDGWSIWADLGPIEPSEGMSIRLYGPGLGRPIRGIVIDGHVFSYRTEEEEQQYWLDYNAEQKRQARVTFDEGREAQLRDIAQLPVPYQQRLAGFMERAPQKAWEFQGYELYICQMAALMAEDAKEADQVAKQPGHAAVKSCGACWGRPAATKLATRRGWHTCSCRRKSASPWNTRASAPLWAARVLVAGPGRSRRHQKPRRWPGRTGANTMKIYFACVPDHIADWLDTLSPEQGVTILTDAYHEHQCRCTSQAAKPTPLPEITLSGHRYVLAEQPQAAEPEPQREPQTGEIWRDGDGELFIVNDQLDAIGRPCLVYVSAGSAGMHCSFCLTSNTFAYDSLAAAVAAGEKFE